MSFPTKRGFINIGLTVVALVVLVQLAFLLVSSSSKSSPSLQFDSRKHKVTVSSSNIIESKGEESKIPIIDFNRNVNPHALSDEVLVLTPLRNAEPYLPLYFKNILQWTYPHSKISLAFLVSDSTDKTFHKLQSIMTEIQTTYEPEQRFKNVTILKKDFHSKISQDEKDRHSLEVQTLRRQVMAKARNYLLNSILSSYPTIKWVLWVDGDVIETPPTFITDLMSHDKDIIVPNCYQRYEGGIRPYDFNNWIDSDVAKEMASKMGEDEVLFEGYQEMATYRTLLAYLYDEGADKNVELLLDGVGATGILVKADVHRHGAYFPMVPMWNLLETEAFAKMAKKMGFEVWGLPNYLIFHTNYQ